jgi:nitronate monooxygenase
MCIALQVPVVGTFWDVDAWLVERLRLAGIVVVHQVGSVQEAIAAERAGLRVIIAQGREAGGHVRGTEPLRDLLPEVTAAVEVPVLAAGGLATGADLVTTLALGAQGMVLGTAMIATHESFAHRYHKQRFLAAEAEDTLLTTDFHINWPPGTPRRVLSSAVTSGARGSPRAAGRTDIGDEHGRPILLFSTDSPLRSMNGDFESMALYAGAGVGRITEITSAGDRLDATIAEAEVWLASAEADEDIETSSPVCYANELNGANMAISAKASLRQNSELCRRSPEWTACHPRRI